MYHVIVIPRGFAHPLVKFYKKYSCSAFKGETLPDDLKEYKCTENSIESFYENEMNGVHDQWRRDHDEFK